MRVHTFVPSSPLSDYVDLLWSVEGPVPAHARERLLPTGTMELVINLRDDALRIFDRDNPHHFADFRGALIAGAHREYFVIDTSQQDAIVGVHFKAGGAFPFFEMPVDELRDRHVLLEDLWGPAARRLRERLLEAPSHEARFRVLEAALLEQARHPLGRHPAVSFALAELQRVPQQQTINQINGQMGFSQRHFIRLFSRQVGLTPKVFCRIRRFQEVLQQIGNRRRVRWAHLAADCGYFDQAHLIRDFQAFSGLNPTSYLSRRGDHFNHVPILD